MKNYICTGGSSLLMMEDGDFKNFKCIDNTHLNIDWVWTVEEDGVFHFNDCEYPVKGGNIILLLYKRYNDVKSEGKINRDMVILDSPVLYELYLKNKAAEEKEKLAESRCCKSCGTCAGACESCISNA